jgi:hypothetical protein
MYRPPIELSPRLRKILVGGVSAIVFALIGAFFTLWITPLSPSDLKQELQKITQENKRLKQSCALLNTPKQESGFLHKLATKDKIRHLKTSQKASRYLQQHGAQGAAELLNWFIQKWNALLDNPHENDRIDRRAALLAFMIAEMANTVDPADYVAWQAEFFTGNWLGDVHFDLDGDGYPAQKNSPNPRDTFTNVSVCQIAMAINLTIADVKIFIMPDLQCEHPQARINIFLHGNTLNEAASYFVKNVKQQGFSIAERRQGPLRFILLGLPPVPKQEAAFP